MSKKKEQSFYELARPLLQKYLPPYKWLVVWGIVAGIVAAAASGFGLPVIVQKVCPVVFGEVPAPEWLTAYLADYVAPEDMPTFTLIASALIIPFVMSLRGMATYVNAYFLTRAGVGVVRGLRTDMFARLQWLSFSFHDRHQRGSLMTTIIQYTQGMQLQLVQVLNDIVVQPLTLMAAVAYLIYAAATNHESAVLLGNLLISCLCIPLVRYVGKTIVKKMRQALAGMNQITANVEESLTAQREVRAFNLEARQERVLGENIREFNKLLIRMAAWQSALSPAIEVVSALALAYSLYRGCGDGLTLEAFTAIATAFYFCYDPIKRLGTVANQCQLMSVMIGGFNELLLAKDETPEPEIPVTLPEPVKGEVDFENVTFAYDEENTVLHDLTVHVPAGDIVALVGPSGSGKTTFINLICRFYDPQSGCVKIDGVNVKDISRAERTRSIGLVSQFAALFRDTITENIRVGRPNATDDEVRQAGDLACVTEFAEMKPEGYNLMLAEGGGGLSGGQKQRVSIARAILKNAPILILDEATSALDMKSEAVIQQSLENMAQSRTTFIIAHRFSTIRMAKRILVFNEGRIVADGNHEQLYESCMLYRSLYDEQVKQATSNQERKENK
ncbi:MAG: ABC transporter ATP-binding protein [Akkermansia sp.]|nr:ABC transporter ATP-binding protein [Akkermansia sp.]